MPPFHRIALILASAATLMARPGCSSHLRHPQQTSHHEVRRRRSLLACLTGDDFAAMCRERLTSDSVVSDSVASQAEFASFLNGLQCLFLEDEGEAATCASEAEAQTDFFELPFFVQLHFVDAVCRHVDDNDDDTQDCMDNLLANKLSGDKFGFLFNASVNDADANIQDLCTGIYDLVVGEGLMPACPAPTASPSALPTQSPTEAPTTLNPTSAPTTITPTTANPSFVPTAAPSTPSPTAEPTANPTNIGLISGAPPQNTSFPTAAPTGNSSGPIIEVDPRIGDGGNQFGPGVFIAIGAGVLFLLGLVLLAFRRFRKTTDDFDEDASGSFPKRDEVILSVNDDSSPEDAGGSGDGAINDDDRENGEDATESPQSDESETVETPMVEANGAISASKQSGEETLEQEENLARSTPGPELNALDEARDQATSTETEAGGMEEHDAETPNAASEKHDDEEQPNDHMDAGANETEEEEKTTPLDADQHLHTIDGSETNSNQASTSDEGGEDCNQEERAHTGGVGSDQSSSGEEAPTGKATMEAIDMPEEEANTSNDIGHVATEQEHVHDLDTEEASTANNVPVTEVDGPRESVTSPKNGETPEFVEHMQQNNDIDDENTEQVDGSAENSILETSHPEDSDVEGEQEQARDGDAEETAPANGTPVTEIDGPGECVTSPTNDETRAFAMEDSQKSDIDDEDNGQNDGFADNTTTEESRSVESDAEEESEDIEDSSINHITEDEHWESSEEEDFSTDSHEYGDSSWDDEEFESLPSEAENAPHEAKGRHDKLDVDTLGSGGDATRDDDGSALVDLSNAMEV